MESMTFDSLRYERQLREVGVSEAQAELQAKTMADACGFWAANIVTKQYLDKTLDARLAEQGRTVDGLFHAQGGKIADLTADMKQRFSEQNGKIGDLSAHMNQRFTEQDAKIAGLSADMKQRFAEQDGKIDALSAEMNHRFADQDAKIGDLRAHMNQRFAEQDLKFEKRFHRVDLQFYTLLVFVVVNSVGGVPALVRLIPL